MADLNYQGNLISLSGTTAADLTDHIASGCIYHSFQAVKTDGDTPSTFSISIKASLDNTSWKTLGSLTTTGDISTFIGLYRYFKFTIGSVASGDTVTIKYVGL